MLREIDCMYTSPRMRERRLVTLVTAAVVWLAAGAASAQSLRIAAASDLQAALPAVAEQFEKETGQKVSLTFGSSGNFFTQIQNGAPFDVFLSADIDYPRQLEQAGLGEKGTLYQYATGRLVLWTRNDSGIDVRRGLAVLSDARVRKIAIANPAHAPYGRAAVAAMRHEGLYDRVQPKIVMGENISQAAQFAQSGNAEIGLLALSLALAPALKSVGRYWQVPENLHPPIEQAAIVVATSGNNELARQFLDSLKRPEIVRILESYGFSLRR
jgi:molybdate transport system substrate-binding protein